MMISSVILQCIDKDNNLIENGKSDLFKNIVSVSLKKTGLTIDTMKLVFHSKYGHRLLSDHFEDLLMIQLGVSVKENPEDEDEYKYIFKGMLANNTFQAETIVLTYQGGQKILDTNPPAASKYDVPVTIDKMMQDNISVIEEFTTRDLALNTSLGPNFSEATISPFNYSDKSLLNFIYETCEKYGFLFTVNYQDSMTNYSLVNPFGGENGDETSLEIEKYYPSYLRFSMNYLELNGLIHGLNQTRELVELRPSNSFSGEAEDEDDSAFQLDYIEQLGYYKVEYLNNFSQANTETIDPLVAFYNKKRLENSRITFASDEVLEIGGAVNFTLNEESGQIDSLAKSLVGSYCVTEIDLVCHKQGTTQITYSAVKI